MKNVKELCATVECIKCHKKIKLWSEEYEKDDWSPAMGHCCDYLYAETDFDGNVGVFDLRKPKLKKRKCKCGRESILNPDKACFFLCNGCERANAVCNCIPLNQRSLVI